MQRFAPWIAAFLGLLFTILCYFPGYLSNDPLAQLAEARRGVFSEWHPPVMALVWRPLDMVWPGPAPMLLFHNLIFWTALALLVTHSPIPKPKQPWWVLGFGLWPGVFALIGTVWKDVGMTSSFLLAVALILILPERRSALGKAITVAGILISLFYGVSCRHNAVTALPPILFLLAFTLTRHFGKAVVGTLGLFLVVLALSKGASKILVKEAGSYPININLQAVLIHDLAAISLRNNEMLIPEYLFSGPKKELTLDTLRGRYSPDNVNPLLSLQFDPQSDRFQFTRNEDEARALKTQWTRAVLSHPFSYLRHRYDVYRKLTSFFTRGVCYPFHTGIDEPNPFGFHFERNLLNRAMLGILLFLQNSFFFRTSLYLAILLGLMALSVKRNWNVKPFVLCIGASGLFYAAPYFAIAGSCDYRYCWWAVICTMMIFLFSFPELRVKSGRKDA